MSKYAKYDQIQGLKQISYLFLFWNRKWYSLWLKFHHFKPNSEIKTIAICSPFRVFQQKIHFYARCDIFVVLVIELSSTEVRKWGDWDWFVRLTQRRKLNQQILPFCQLRRAFLIARCPSSVRPLICKLFTFSSFSPEPLGNFQPNLAQSIIGC